MNDMLQRKKLYRDYFQLIEGAKNIYSNESFLRITEHKWFGKYSYFLIYNLFGYSSVIEINFWQGTNDVNIAALISDEWAIDIVKKLQNYFSILGFNIKKWV